MMISSYAQHSLIDHHQLHDAAVSLPFMTTNAHTHHNHHHHHGLVVAPSATANGQQHHMSSPQNHHHIYNGLHHQHQHQQQQQQQHQQHLTHYHNQLTSVNFSSTSAGIGQYGGEMPLAPHTMEYFPFSGHSNQMALKDQSSPTHQSSASSSSSSSSSSPPISSASPSSSTTTNMTNGVNNEVDSASENICIKTNVESVVNGCDLMVCLVLLYIYNVYIFTYSWSCTMCATEYIVNILAIEL